MEKLFKVSVSDWKFVFETGEEVIFNTLLDEEVFISAGGETKIKLNNATFDSKFVDLFKKGVKVKNVEQTFELVKTDNIKTDVAETVKYNYLNLHIKNIRVVSSVSGVATTKIVLY